MFAQKIEIPIGLFFYFWTNLAPWVLIFEDILELFSNLFYAPLSGLSWNTNTYLGLRTKELRLGCFSVCPTDKN